jgi:hypothetical protein
MFYSPCAACGTPKSITEVHGWLAGHAVCSAACAQAAHASGRYEERRTPGEVLDGLLALLAETGEIVRVSAGRASRAESSLHTAVMLQGDAAVWMFGALPAALAGAAHESMESAYTEDTFEIDHRLQRVVREVMCLESLGVPAASHISEIVQRYGTLSSHTASGMRGVLTQLWYHLKEVYEALRAIRAAHQGPFR